MNRASAVRLFTNPFNSSEVHSCASAASCRMMGTSSRTRVCQILMLANLAPAIQEALLFLPKTVRGPDRITENRLRDIVGLVDWEAQIQLFRFHLAGSQQ